MSISKVYFTTEDNLKLTGLLYMPENRGLFGRVKETKKVVIFIHGMYSNCLRKRDDIFGEKLNEAGYAYFTFNNRGAEVGNLNREVLHGTAFENVYDSYMDIDAAIKVMEKRGFKDINILGHSLGCSKILNWYPKKNYNVNSVGLLSLTALSDKYRQVAGEEQYKKSLDIAKFKISEGKGKRLLPEDFYPRPICASTLVDLFDFESEFNTVFYEDENWKAESLNTISEPLFMRYGTINETITKEPGKIVELIKRVVLNEKLNVDYIEGADHSYHGKEYDLADQYIKFLNERY